MRGSRLAVHHWRICGHAGLAQRDLLLHGGVGREQPCHWHALQFSDLPLLQPQLGEQQIRVLHRVLARRQTKNSATFDDRPVKEPFRVRHRHQRCNLPAASRLTEDRDEIRITAEPCNVVAHPFEGGHKIKYTSTAR